jgi:hypothetical protein
MQARGTVPLSDALTAETIQAPLLAAAAARPYGEPASAGVRPPQVLVPRPRVGDWRSEHPSADPSQPDTDADRERSAPDIAPDRHVVSGENVDGSPTVVAPRTSAESTRDGLGGEASTGADWPYAPAYATAPAWSPAPEASGFSAAPEAAEQALGTAATASAAGPAVAAGHPAVDGRSGADLPAASDWPSPAGPRNKLESLGGADRWSASALPGVSGQAVARGRPPGGQPGHDRPVAIPMPPGPPRRPATDAAPPNQAVTASPRPAAPVPPSAAETAQPSPGFAASPWPATTAPPDGVPLVGVESASREAAGASQPTDAPPPGRGPQRAQRAAGTAPDVQHPAEHDAVPANGPGWSPPREVRNRRGPWLRGAGSIRSGRFGSRPISIFSPSQPPYDEHQQRESGVEAQPPGTASPAESRRTESPRPESPRPESPRPESPRPESGSAESADPDPGDGSAQTIATRPATYPAPHARFGDGDAPHGFPSSDPEETWYGTSQVPQPAAPRPPAQGPVGDEPPGVAEDDWDDLHRYTLLDQPTLPHRVPAKPDVPFVEPGELEALDDVMDEVAELPLTDVDGPDLSRIASRLRHDEESVPELPDELDVAAVLAAVRQVYGVRSAQLRPNPGGVHILRLELADDADAGRVSRQVARLLKERMGLAAEPRRSRTAAEDIATPAVRPPNPSVPTQGESATVAGAPGFRPTMPGEPGAFLAGMSTVAAAAPLAPVPGQPPRIVLDQVHVSTLGTEATVEVRLHFGTAATVGKATGPAVDAYLLRLAAQAAAGAIDSLVSTLEVERVRLRVRRPSAAPIRCFIEHAGVVPFGSSVVAVVVVLVSGDGRVEQLVGSALVAGDPRQSIVRATLAAVNRRLESLLT